MNEVFALKDGTYEFGPLEDNNLYTYENDEDVIKELATKLGGEYELIDRAMVMHPTMGIRIPVMIFTKLFARCESDKMLLGVYTTTKDDTLSVQKFFSVCRMVEYSSLVNDTTVTFACAEIDTVRAFVGSSWDEEKNNIILEGHYMVVSFKTWEYFHRLDQHFETMNFEYIYLHMMDETWKMIIKVY